MIRFANKHTEHLVRSMWKTCFDDTDEFIDLHFARKYKNENTLIYFDQDEAVASLQMFEYNITFYGEVVPFYYLAGLCTLPTHQRNGYMAQLINQAHIIMKERNIAMSILVPAEEWLFSFYGKYGYEQVFEADEKAIPLKDILDTYPDINEAYRIFNVVEKEKDFCVQKSLDDFVTIVDEFKMDNHPTKYNLSGMARIIDPQPLLNLYAAQKLKTDADPHTDVYIKVSDASRSSVYRIQHGLARLCSEDFIDIKVDIKLLCRLLFGFKISKLPEPYSDLFAEHRPTMNLMLE